MPKLTHPDSKQTIDRPEDQVSMYESQGWRSKEEVAAEKAAAKKTTATKGGSK